MLLSASNAHESESAAQQQSVAMPTAAHDGAKPRANHTPVSRPVAIEFRRAVKRDAKVRLALTGPSGSGKTYTLLKIASELGGPIALVDTERRSAEKYADLFEFDTLPLESFSPDLVPRLIETAVANGYRVLIIDSLSHFWTGTDGELDQVEKVKRRLRDNGFAAWREITPKHNRMIDAMLSAPIHILVSMRVKTEWVMETEERTGKTKPRKIGLQPVMRDGIEYEFDVCGDMDQENTLQITKSRCPQLSGGVFPKPGREVVGILKEWLRSEVAPSHDLQASSDLPHTPEQSNGVDQSQAVPTIPPELASIWKRMCHPRGVVKEFEDLKSEIEQLAGSTGIAEYSRLLRQHGVDHPKRFRASQPARLCGKDVFGMLEELRANARENQSQLDLEAAGTEVSESGVGAEAR
jgi:hypothetical protein